MKSFIFSTVFLFCSNCYAISDWIPYTPNTVVYPTIEVPLTPTVTYTNITIQPNVIRYQWVPIFVNRPVIINQNGLFVRRQQVVYQTVVEWVIQPINY